MAHFALLLAAAFWGGGNIAQKLVLSHIGPMSAVCLRCAIAAIAILPLAATEWQRHCQAGFPKSMLLVSISFTAAICLQQLAYIDSSVTNASFLVNTCTVLTPLIGWLLLREPSSRLVLCAGVMTLSGVFLMSSGSLASGPGDLYCLASAFMYAIWMVALGRHAQAYDMPFSSAFMQFALAALIGFPFLMAKAPAPADIGTAAPNLAILGLFTTAAAFGLQTWAQRYTSASRAAVIVSAESIFGAAGAIVVLGERPREIALLGAALIFLAIVAVSLRSDDQPAERLFGND
jgi:drug/metabolite transporter (DMT)-like permease